MFFCSGMVWYGIPIVVVWYVYCFSMSTVAVWYGMVWYSMVCGKRNSMRVGMCVGLEKYGMVCYCDMAMV